MAGRTAPASLAAAGRLHHKSAGGSVNAGSIRPRLAGAWGRSPRSPHRGPVSLPAALEGGGVPLGVERGYEGRALADGDLLGAGARRGGGAAGGERGGLLAQGLALRRRRG